ncbi:MAG: hypothetical protein HUU15_12635 [Candidatus Brocadiae bacterium]|nr:hypothetical protein [Candidatus Brocadiia bacterium]
MSRGPSPARFLRNARELFTDRAVTIDGNLTAVTDARLGWGWTATLFALPALAWLLWRHPRSRLPVAAASVGAALTLLMVEYDPWNARFLIWFSAVPCIAVAALCPATRFPALAALVATAGSLANLAQNALPPVFETREAFSALASRPWRERDMLRCVILRDALKEPGAGMAAYREQLLADTPVLALSGGSPVAALARGDYSRRLEFSPADDPAGIPALARDLNCDLIFSQDGNGLALPPVREAVRRGGLTEIAPGWFRVGER